MQFPRASALLFLALPAGAEELTFAATQQFLTSNCAKCHSGKTAAGGFVLNRLTTADTLQTAPVKWTRAALRVRNGEMPPKGAGALTVDEREQFAQWVDRSVRGAVCSAGVKPSASHIRRLNRDEYSATIRDLLDIHLDLAKMLPSDGSGGEGFDNAAETLFLSPLHSEKYLEVAKFATDFASKEYKSRSKVIIARPGPGLTSDQAAHKILEAFLPKAFRRPVAAADVAPYVTLFRAASQQGQPFEQAVWFAIRGALVSPMFLFRVEPPNPDSKARLLDQFSLASRLSYFLWGSMPDELLSDVAAAGKLNDTEFLQQLIRRMLRNDRSLGFAQRFIEQWLRTRELATDKAPDAKLYPAYAADEDLRSDVRNQPVLFFREVFIRNLPLTNFIDSKGTIGTRKLAQHFNEKLPLNNNASSQPQWVELPADSRRGGLLGMPAVLAVASYPYRTSPVLRGAWVLDSILGTPPPPPPPNVPPLEETSSGSTPRSMKERLTQHRANAVCASCHTRIDPWGFALENYDPIGKWRDDEGGKPIDNTSELLDGTQIHGPAALKAALMERKDLFLRNLTNKMLGYALGRGLTLQDSCAVDAILAKVKENNYSAQSLIEGIVMSVPFQQQAGRASAPPMKKEAGKP
ncbi:MAG: DUF1588 domain-containing protein [Acidobacteria bacterium]|nr:DUF1588 domain-containing protein [Acidobacteriota bacterium]